MTTQPILVMMSYRGGVRLQRCLESIAQSRHHFARVILSITSSTDSDDMRQAESFREAHPDVEVICTGVELPTMQHQEFWITYLENTGVKSDSWIYWLAYDDEVRNSGICELIDDTGNWPLSHGTAYFGPWAMRHEQADRLWDGDRSSSLESWTSFASVGPLRLPVLRWIDDQLRQPTYMQMSGSVCSFESFRRVRDGLPRKRGPMRIEMAVAATPCNSHVEEFPTPVSIIYGRPNSDRASYGAAARGEDRHLLAWMAIYTLRHPRSVGTFLRLGCHQLSRIAHRSPAPAEEWRVRGTVHP
jgi:hypothetical protein